MSHWLNEGIARTTQRAYTSGLALWRAFTTLHNLDDQSLFTPDTYDLSKRALTISSMKRSHSRSSSQIKRTLHALLHDLLVNFLDITVFIDPSITLARRAVKESARVLHKIKKAHHRLPVTFDVLS